MVRHNRRMSDPARPLLSFTGVSKIYGRGESEVRALDNVDLAIGTGEFVAIRGSSGSGKSTCLNILGCLDTPTTGCYRFDGDDVGGFSRRQQARLRRQRIGFVFQSFNLLPRTAALPNVELPLVYQRVSRGERRRRASEALEQVGLADRMTHAPSELSGGQKQRVAIARALVTQPSVLLADEPTGNLDSESGEAVMAMITALNREQGLTVVLVTHEAETAAHADRELVFRDGIILSSNAPATNAPATNAAATNAPDSLAASPDGER